MARVFSKSTFSKASSRRGTWSGFPPALPIGSPKKGITLGYIVYEVSVEAGRAAQASPWSGALVAIQTQINRGGTLELMIEDGGVEACRGAGWALRSPGALKSEGPERITHTFSPRSGGDSHTAAVSPSKLLRLFSTTCHISAEARDIRVGCMATWEFRGLGTWKTFSGALLELVASIVTVDYWHTAGPLAAIYWGKIVFGRVCVSLLQGRGPTWLSPLVLTF